MNATESTDIVVIGSGFGGAIAAYHLAAGGANVVVLERGPWLSSDEFQHDFVLGSSSSRIFDFVFGDTFNDFEVPYHLTTREFNELLARHLQPDGLYLLNVIDSVHFDFLRSEVRTLRKTFPYVALISTPGNWPPRREDRQRGGLNALPAAQVFRAAGGRLSRGGAPRRAARRRPAR